MLRFSLFFFVLLFIYCLPANAQDYSFFSATGPGNPANSGNHSLSFQFQSMSFLKNNEYFNPLDEGITFLGTVFNPRLQYRAGSQILLHAGWYGVLYAGRDNISLSLPYYNAEWQFANGYSVKMGNINGYHNHRLPEPLLSVDRMYTENPETGVQVTGETKRHHSDVWLNWENFILPGENDKEEFVIGGRSFVFLKPLSEGLNVALTLNGMAAHRGGQVGAEGNMSTLMNSATGLMAWYNPSGTTDSIGIRNDFYGYNDASPVKLKLYSRGWGNYTTCFARIKGYYIEGGFWYGRHYIAPRGEWLYQSVSRLYTVYWEPTSTMVTVKGGWTHTITDGIKAALGGGCYYDIPSQSFDFYYQFHLSLKLDWLIREFKR